VTDGDVTDGAWSDADRRLLGDWMRTVRSAGASGPEAALAGAGRALLARWHEPHRRYHDAVHLAAVLDGLDTLARDPLAQDQLAQDATAAVPPAVRLAAWFHDAVYAGRPGQDEQDSAALAHAVLHDLAVPDAVCEETARLVRVTAAHDPAPDDDAGALLCDADLAVLAGDETAYSRYAAAVRAEYAHVPDDLFRAGRAAVLTALLAAPALFRTAQGRTRWEARARANVAAEIARLAPQ
jgi:predicted metal-dependent HD superfamily phosphohydrolase